MPKVLISDELSPKALAIFRSRGIETDVCVGLKKADLLKVIERHGDTVGRDTDQIEKTIMMGLTYRAPAEREKAALARITAISGATPEQARRQMMIGSREECLETIDRYLKVGVTHFIFTLPRPFYLGAYRRRSIDVIAGARTTWKATRTAAAMSMTSHPLRSAWEAFPWEMNLRW